MGLLFFGFEPFTGIRTGKTGLIPVISVIRRGEMKRLLGQFIVGFGVFSSLPECFEIKSAISSTVFVTLAHVFCTNQKASRTAHVHSRQDLTVSLGHPHVLA